ncbi:hypothetical protein GPUN_1723 [Glaciecola punicea ACAM 611]|uniref:Uncharacterized protein n=1 Tax=Glaciecola punicea ACAM 611 TaxID=1121923 RepID=H5TC12_9ALTE|nr:hypothetical protein GPUN_1723 [Glaciecola punicea ACAM 611]
MAVNASTHWSFISRESLCGGAMKNGWMAMIGGRLFSTLLILVVLS